MIKRNLKKKETMGEMLKYYKYTNDEVALILKEKRKILLLPQESV